MKKLILLILFLSNISFASDYWKQPMHSIKPTSIAINGANIFIGTNFGVYLSTDYGESWTAKNNGLTSLVITCISSYENNIFAGTYDKGVFRSTDYGESWVAINSGLPALETKYLFTNGNKIFAYVDDYEKKGLFQTTNNGENWTKVNLVVELKYNKEITVQDSKMYVGTTKNDGGILVSTDNGDNWEPLGINIPDGTSVKNIAFKDSEIFIILTELGVYRSSDNGNSWVEVNNGIEYYNEINKIVTVNDKIFVCSNYYAGCYMSSDNGENWSPYFINNQKVSSFSFIIENGSDVFAGLNGLYISTDNCNSWTALNSGLSNTYINHISIFDSNIFAGTTNGVFKSTDKGVNWFGFYGNINFGGLISGIVKKGEKYFVASNYYTNSYGVICSEDNGGTWTKVNKGITDTSISSLILDNGNLYAGTYRGKIFFSSNDGEKWEDITVLNSYFPTNVQQVSVTVKDSVIYAGTSWGVFKSTNNGDYWRQITYEMSNTAVYCLTFVGDNLYLGTKTGVIYTSDYGATWVALNKGMENIEVNCLKIYDSYIFAGTSKNGVYLSIDKGENWVEINSGLYCFEIRGLEILDSVLYAGTYGAGTYSAKISDIIISDVQEQTVQTYEISIFPNPATNEITLSFPNEQNINSISIFNTLGIEIKRIEQSEIIGNKKISISTADLPVGLYHCSFVNQVGSVTKSFVVVR